MSIDPSIGTISNMVRDLVQQCVQQLQCVLLWVEVKKKQKQKNRATS